MSTTAYFRKMLGMPPEPSPYQEGMAAAKRPWATWFDCPYTGRDPASRNKQREWMAGWDFIKRGQL